MYIKSSPSSLVSHPSTSSLPTFLPLHHHQPPANMSNNRIYRIYTATAEEAESDRLFNLDCLRSAARAAAAYDQNRGDMELRRMIDDTVASLRRRNISLGLLLQVHAECGGNSNRSVCELIRRIDPSVLPPPPRPSATDFEAQNAAAFASNNYYTR